MSRFVFAWGILPFLTAAAFAIFTFAELHGSYDGKPMSLWITVCIGGMVLVFVQWREQENVLGTIGLLAGFVVIALIAEFAMLALVV